MSVSVIITTFNRSLLLHRLLSGLANQTFPKDNFEVIVVDDGSTDDTVSICINMLTVLPNLVLIRMETNSGQSRSAVRGIAQSKGDKLLFTDDDCIPDQDWVEKLQQSLSEHPIVAGAIRTPINDYKVVVENISEFHPFLVGHHSRVVSFIAGANMGYRKEVFDTISSFKPGYAIPDMELILRARECGFPIFFNSKAIVTHDQRRGNFSKIFQHASHASFHTIQLRNKYATLLKTPFVLKSSALVLLFSPIITLVKTVEIFCENCELLKVLHAIPGVFLLKLAWCWGAFRGLRNIHR